MRLRGRCAALALSLGLFANTVCAAEGGQPKPNSTQIQDAKKAEPALASFDDWIRRVSINLSRRTKRYPCASSTWKMHEYVDVTNDSLRKNLQLVWIAIPKACAALAVRAPDAQGDTLAIFSSFEQDRPIAIITGGYAHRPDKKDVPQGLHISSGAEIVPFTYWGRKPPVAGGIIAGSRQGLRIIRSQEWLKIGGAFTEALQSKPILVENGAPATSDDSTTASRLAVAIDDAESLHVFAAYSDDSNGVSLQEFATLLSRIASHARLKRLSALNLDGGPSTRIYLPQLKRFIGKVGTGYVASLLLVGETSND